MPNLPCLYIIIGVDWLFSANDVKVSQLLETNRKYIGREGSFCQLDCLFCPKQLIYNHYKSHCLTMQIDKTRHLPRQSEPITNHPS